MIEDIIAKCTKETETKELQQKDVTHDYNSSTVSFQ
jgi:hypothetical protein